MIHLQQQTHKNPISLELNILLFIPFFLCLFREPVKKIKNESLENGGEGQDRVIFQTFRKITIKKTSCV